jgi:hypothetical protein
VTKQLQFSEPVEGTVNPAAGKAAKVRGMKRVSMVDPEWAAQCDKAIRDMAKEGGVFQAVDLITEGLVVEPPHPNCWGPRFLAASRAGVIEPAGIAQSKRATVHRSLCRAWKGTAAYRDAA